MGSALRSPAVITEESWLVSGAVRSSLFSALTLTVVETASGGNTMRSRAAPGRLVGALGEAVADDVTAALAGVPGITIGVRTVSNPDSETTSVKAPGWGATSWKLPSPSEWMMVATAPLASRRSISALGTMAPVASATTPCTAGADGGAAGDVVLVALRNEDVYKNAAKARNRKRISKLQKVQRKQGLRSNRAIFKQKKGPSNLAAPKGQGTNLVGSQGNSGRFRKT